MISDNLSSYREIEQIKLNASPLLAPSASGRVEFVHDQTLDTHCQFRS